MLGLASLWLGVQQLHERNVTCPSLDSWNVGPSPMDISFPASRTKGTHGRRDEAISVAREKMKLFERNWRYWRYSDEGPLISKSTIMTPAPDSKRRRGRSEGGPHVMAHPHSENKVADQSGLEHIRTHQMQLINARQGSSQSHLLRRPPLSHSGPS